MENKIKLHDKYFVPYISNEEIMKMLQNNPDIIKRVNQIMGGGNIGR